MQEPLASDVVSEELLVSEGLQVMQGQVWHEAGFQGSGVRVAIIDQGFLGYSALAGLELPYNVSVKNFVDGENDLQVDGTTRQGTACAEVIHDIAPQAALYLVKISTPADLAEAVYWLLSQDIDIISTSLGWYNLTPGDGSGQFADLAQLARSNGVLWVTAAGDSRQKHWGGLFNDLDGDGYHEFAANAEVTYFVQNDGSAFNVPAGTLIRGYLRWDDWDQVNQDYDLDLMRFDAIQGWKLVATSANRQSGLPGQTPSETIEISAPQTAKYGFRITRYDSTRPVNLEFFAEGPAPLSQRVSARSLLNLADAPDVMTVSAVDVASPFAQEFYSSEGPTNGPGGSLEGGQDKPDIAAYANVSTASYGAQAFYGTVAAAPHAAGAAALVKSINPAFSPDQVQGYLQSMAVDLGNPGVDPIYGYGRLVLDHPLAFFTPPVMGALPDQFVPVNTSLTPAIDLWQYSYDSYSDTSQLTFSLDNLPAVEAGVSIRENRYIDIQPYTGWTGETQVTVRVTNPYGLSSAASLNIYVSQYKFWNGEVSSDWLQPANWTPAGAPSINDKVIIPPKTNQPVLFGDGEVRDLTVLPGAILDLGQYPLTVEGTVSNQGTLVQEITALAGQTSSILRLTNQSGDQVKYLGLELFYSLPPGSPMSLTSTAQIIAAVSGEQHCTGRFTGVSRCFELQTDQPITADLRFYFSQTEANGIPPETLAAFLEEGGWIEQGVPYESGSRDQVLYLDAFGLTGMGRFALDTVGRGGYLLLLLLVHK